MKKIILMGRSASGKTTLIEALKGEELDVPQQERFYPAYDSQKEIFQGILTELEEANQLLKEGTLKIDGDIIYNGDVAKWRRLAMFMPLRRCWSCWVKAASLPEARKTICWRR